MSRHDCVRHRTHARGYWSQTELKITYASSADNAELHVCCYDGLTSLLLPPDERSGLKRCGTDQPCSQRYLPAVASSLLKLPLR